MPFPRVLAWSKLQTALSRIWTWLADSISYDDNHYAKCMCIASINIFYFIYEFFSLILFFFFFLLVASLNRWTWNSLALAHLPAARPIWILHQMPPLFSAIFVVISIRRRLLRMWPHSISLRHLVTSKWMEFPVICVNCYLLCWLVMGWWRTRARQNYCPRWARVRFSIAAVSVIVHFS